MARAMIPPADEPIILEIGIVQLLFSPNLPFYLIDLYAPTYAKPLAPPPWKAKWKFLDKDILFLWNFPSWKGIRILFLDNRGSISK